MTLNISSGKISRAVKTVIYGPEGIGKSTLASQFPNPLFLDMEGGTAQMDVRRIEKPNSWPELIATVNEVAKTQGICGTLVLDTADWTEGMLIGHICKVYNQKSIESFGYGKGYTYLGEEWQKLMDAFTRVIEAGMNVTIIAHAKQRKIELPDQAGSFDHWEMKLSRQVAPLLKEWSDLLLFLNYKTYIVTTDNNTRKAQGGKRVMYTSHNPVWDAKNRHGLPEEVEMSFKPLEKIFEEQGARSKDSVARGQDGDRTMNGDSPMKGQSPKSPVDRLKELMAEAGIEDYQVREVLCVKQGFPAEKPLEEYPETVIGTTVKYFDRLVKQIKGEQA